MITTAPATAAIESALEIKSREDAEKALSLKKAHSLEIEERKLKRYRAELVTGGITQSIKRLEMQVDLIDSQLRIWAEKNRGKEFGESNTLQLINGILEFKWGPPAIRVLADWTEKTVAAALWRKRALKHFVRVKHEVDRQQIGRALAAGEVSAKELARVGLESKPEEFFSIKAQ